MKKNVVVVIGVGGTVKEVAAVAAFRLGSEASFITGSDFLVDGGVTAVRTVNGVH